MKCLPILAGLLAVVTVTGCSTRIEVDHEQTAESSTERTSTIVEVSSLDSPSPAPAEPPPDPQPPFIDLEGTGNVIVLGDVEDHHHLHFHKAPKPSNVRVEVRVKVEAIDERDRVSSLKWFGATLLCLGVIWAWDAARKPPRTLPSVIIARMLITSMLVFSIVLLFGGGWYFWFLLSHSVVWMLVWLQLFVHRLGHHFIY